MPRALTAQGTTSRARLRGSRPGLATGWIPLAVAAAIVLASALVVGWAFAGSKNTLAPGTRIAGVPVGGLTPKAARQLLAHKSAQLAYTPVAFTAGGKTFELRPVQLGITVDWATAVASAQDQGDGVGIVRGYRRLAMRFFPQDIAPQVHSYNAALQYELGMLAMKIDRPARDARIVRHGLTFRIVQGQTGEVLDQTAAAKAIVAALGKFSRGTVALPLEVEQPKLTVRDLQPQLAVVRRIVSAPVTVVSKGTTIRLSPLQLAGLVSLPTAGQPQLTLGGSVATHYFARLAHTVGHAPVDANFAVDGSSVRVLPAQSGTTVDVIHSAAAVLAAAERTQNRTAKLVVVPITPQRSTAEARAMGITGLVGSYETIYGGIPNRIHNVQLVAHLIDGTFVAPGATFSFNQTTGARTAAKGFVEAPVIINGEVETGLGGGVCQVSTTVFNAAYESGLPITARTNHALYISHYPLGRDATVDYPDVDLKFVNDTDHWLLLRTFVGSYSLVVSLYGTPQHRRVVSETAPLTVTSPAPVKRQLDRALKPGQSVVEEDGQPAQSTSVRRLVYAPDGKLLYDNTWYSNYESSPEILLVGPKKKPPPPAKPVQTVH